jgi:hypothetical protein
MCRLPYCSESMPHRPPIPQIAVFGEPGLAALGGQFAE